MTQPFKRATRSSPPSSGVRLVFRTSASGGIDSYGVGFASELTRWPVAMGVVLQSAPATFDRPFDSWEAWS